LHKKPLVVVTRNLPEASLRILKPHFRVDYHGRSSLLPRRDLLRRVRTADGLLCLLTESIDVELFNAAPRLRIVATLSAGLNHIDLAEATRRGVLVTHTPGVLTETCADFTWALLLAAARRLIEADRFLRRGKFQGWDPLMLLGTDIHGKTLGIIGFGRIGQAVARRAGGFGMKVLYANRRPVLPEVAGRLHAERVAVDELLQRSDFVSIHAALTTATRRLIGGRRLGLMKPSAFLVNTARGPIVDERALVRALRRGALRGAALDVFEDEPRLAAGLMNLPNVVLTPHISSASQETRQAMGNLAAESLVECLVRGRLPRNTANPDALASSRRA
jgi:glyoxylate reductase